MVGTNHGICHTCIQKGHLFVLYLEKLHCPWFKHAFVKCFEMGKKSKKKGKLFNSCSTNSGYMQWVGDGETSSESSANYIISNNHVMNGKAKERSIMFESRCIVTDK